MTQVAALGAVERERSSSHRLLVAGLSILAILLLIASLSIGYAPLDLKQAALDILAGGHTLAALVLVELRLPRALLGGLVGFSLGMTGAAPAQAAKTGSRSNARQAAGRAFARVGDAGRTDR
jgi:ABC-type enterobactin transport system permease subunit